MTHELFVGLYGTNDLRSLVPNFVWTFGGFKCTKAIDDGKSVVSYCRDNGTAYDYILLENVRSENGMAPTSVDKLLLDVNFSADDYIALYLQLLYALHTANREINFTHYDLHTGNVLIKQFNDTQSILYKTEKDEEWCNTRYVAVVIDLGNSYFTYADENGNEYNSGLYGYEEYGVSGNDSFPLHDAYKFLCYTLLNLKRHKQQDKFNYIAKILNFFNTDEDFNEIIDEQRDYFYSLPNDTNLTTVSLLKLTAFIRAEYNVTAFTPIPKGKEITCVGQCKDESIYLNKLYLGEDNMPSSMITLSKYLPNIKDEDLITQIKENYTVYEDDARSVMKKIMHRTVDLKKSIDLDLNKINNILQTASIDKLKDIKFMDSYKNYLTIIVKYSALLGTLRNWIDATDNVSHNLQITSKSIEAPIHYFNKGVDFTRKIKTSLASDRNSLGKKSQFIAYLNSLDTRDEIKKFYTSTLNALYEAI